MGHDDGMTRAKTRPKAESATLAELEKTKPSFTLYADDLMAPETLQRWVVVAREMGAPSSRVKAAERAAERMNEWRHRRRKSLPPPRNEEA